MQVNVTVELLRAIGSPFVLEHNQASLPDGEQALRLYGHAAKNKIGLLYLETIRNQGGLEQFKLDSYYREETTRNEEQAATARRVSGLFNSFGVNYAIFKSIMPFAATPNDVDILHFGSVDEYRRAAEIMLQSSYLEVKGQADSSQRLFHDAQNGGRRAPHPPDKDVYDVDLYQKAAASYLIYLDKRKLEKHITEVDRSGVTIRVLSPGAELAAMITHSIIPEQLCTLLVHYATLHYLAAMDSEGIRQFIEIAKENNVTLPVRAHCSLAAELHQAAHGFVPEPVKEVLAVLGHEAIETHSLLKNHLRMPHRYSWLTIGRTIFEKAKEGEFRTSLAIQTVRTLNPKLAKWVLSEVIRRRRRETY